MITVPFTIVEGPAGGGKTTWIDIQAETTANTFIDAHQFISQRPRDYGELGFYADALSQLKDQAALITLAAYVFQNQMMFQSSNGHGELPYEGTPMVDRFLISQIVYNSLRGQKHRSFLLREHIRRAAYHIPTQFDSIFETYALRQTSLPVMFSPGPAKLETHFMFIMPSLSQLIERRANSGKSYPFRAEDEYDLYWKAIRALENNFSVGVVQ